jgi:peroxin-14
MIEKNKESQNQSLVELQQELKSLKALLLSRGPTVSSTPSSPMPLLGRPSIPAWQLATTPGPTTPQPQPQRSSPPTNTPTNAPIIANAVATSNKKEVDTGEDPSS